MYIPDPIEQMEARAERMEDLYYTGHWHCCECGGAIEPGHEEMPSPDPAAPPICSDCLRPFSGVPAGDFRPE